MHRFFSQIEPSFIGMEACGAAGHVDAARELLVKQRTMSVNALRSHLSEFGIIIAKGIGCIDEIAQAGRSKDAARQEPAPGSFHYHITCALAELISRPLG
jgi:transposase